MGDAQFDGGGSVSWEVVNSDGESGGGNKNKCKGKDKDPKGEDGSFAVIANGSLMFTLPATKGNTIKILWGPSAVSFTAAAGPAMSARVSASRVKKKTSTTT